MSNPEIPDSPPVADSSEGETAALIGATAENAVETIALDDPAPEAPPTADEGATAPLADLAAPAAPTEPAVPLAPPVPAALPPAFTGLEPALTAPAPAPPPAPSADAATGPRVRWAGILWGLVLAGIAAAALALLGDASRRAAALEWVLTLSPAAAVAYVVLVLGGFALVAGVVGLARRAQRAGERRRAASAR